MSVIGVTMVKDEADVIERTLRHLHAEGLDGVVALENQSADDTTRILSRLREELGGDWLHVVDDPEVGYWQSAKMTAAAKMARDVYGATWVLPFDADEVWTTSDERSLRDAIMLHGDGANGQAAMLFDHYATALDPGEPDAPEDDPFTRMGWRSATPLSLPKVVVRAAAMRRIDAGNHGAKLTEATWSSGHYLAVHHFPWRGPEQAVRKVTNGSRAYKATNLPETTGLHWRQMGDALDALGPDAIRAWWRDGFFYSDPAASGLVYDPAPVSA